MPRCGEFVGRLVVDFAHEQAAEHTERFTEKEAAPGGSGGKPLEAWSEWEPRREGWHLL